MSNCHVSNQIANHCNEEESICPECGANMYIELGETDLVCSECGNTIDTEESE